MTKFLLTLLVNFTLAALATAQGDTKTALLLAAAQAQPAPALNLTVGGKTAVAPSKLPDCDCQTGGVCTCVGKCACEQPAPALKPGEVAPGWRKALPGETYDHVRLPDGRIVPLGYTAGGPAPVMFGGCTTGSCGTGR